MKKLFVIALLLTCYTSCHALLCEPSKNVMVATENSFRTDIEKGYVVVDFCASWCSPCVRVAPEFNLFADKFVGQFKSIRVDDNDVIFASCDVHAIPCIIVFKDGKEVDRTYGLHTCASLREKFEAFTGTKLKADDDPVVPTPASPAPAVVPQVAIIENTKE